MEEKFNPKDFASFDELPEEKKSEFKSVEGGFVKKTAIENDEKAELIAHAENSVMSKIDEEVKIAPSRVKERLIAEANEKGREVEEEYNKEQRLRELEELGKNENVLDAVQRLKTSFEEQRLEYGDVVEVYLKDGSREEGYHDDGGGGRGSRNILVKGQKKSILCTRYTY